MHLNRVLIFSGLAVLAAIVSASALDAVNLKRNAKVGDEANYTLVVRLDLEGIGEIEVTAEITDEVKKVDKDGSVTVASSTTNQVVTMAGSVIEGSDEEALSTTTFAKSGMITKIESDQMDTDAYRFANLMNILWPTEMVDVGSEWKAETKANTSKGTYDMSYSYSVVERVMLHGRDCFNIKFDTKETSGGEASTNGNVWIDVKTGLMVKILGEMHAIPMQGMEMDGQFNIEIAD